MDSDCPCSGASLDKLLQPAILSALTEGPIHGYRLSERIDEMVGMHGDKPDVSGIYRFLKKMETTGHVVSSWEAGSKGHAKRLYEITAEGRACLARWTSTLETYMDAVGRLLTEAKAAVARQPNRRKIGEKQTVTNAGMDASHGIGRDGFDSLDLKVLLLTQGIFVREEVFKAFGSAHHISPDPLECSVLFLPDGTVVHIANTGPAAPFHLALGSKGNLCLLREGDFVTEVSLPKTTGFYRQRTSRGVPFRGLAVLQGHDVLAFPYLWPCEFAKAGQACKFCHCGNYTQHQTTVGVPENVVFAPRDVAEAVDYAVNVEHCARHIQLTGGSTLDAGGECGRIIEILESIDDIAGIANIPGEIIVYTTPPAMAKEIDSLFAAGADRIACDIEIWNEELFRQICPGKSQWTGRQRALDVLLHITEVYGPNKACSTFVVGLEPAEDFLAGAEYLARNGIVPIPSIWLPHGLPPVPSPVKADLDFFGKIKRGLAEIYDKYNCPPPGELGFNVCLCRDTWNHRAEILSLARNLPRPPCTTNSIV